MALTQFDPPGFSDDLTAPQREAWSSWISEQLTEARERTDTNLKNYGPRLQFFNPLVQPPSADAVEKDISWAAFPRVIQVTSAGDKQRWQRADASRDVQDEYCEWSVERDTVNGKLTKVAFTCEGPEYWQFLAGISKDKVVELYRQHVHAEVTEEDLFPGGVYDKRNRWNNSTTGGAMHLIQRANTLGAEIELAAGASIVRLVNGTPLTSEQDLIACGVYGEPRRHSDPHIGAVVNELARARADVTLANPVGLYLAGLSVQGWSTPDGADPSAFWRVTRGTPAKALRAVFEVPKELGYSIGAIKINGRAIDFAAQIADNITIKLTGLATRIGLSSVTPKNGCVAKAPPVADAGELSVSAILGAPRRRGRI
jgi:hypothetical protein